jgi:hypothetical protein
MNLLLAHMSILFRKRQGGARLSHRDRPERERISLSNG